MRSHEELFAQGKRGHVLRMAGAIFLASDDASYYVGQVLGPNGGDVMF